MGDTVDAIGYKTDVKSRTRDRVVGVKDKLVGTASDATPDSEQVKGQARRAKSLAQDNPLGLAIGSIAVGFVAGLLVPATHFEDEKLGEASDHVIAKAKETGEQALEHGKQVAQETAQSAQDTLKESAQEHGQQVKETAQA